MEGSDELRLNGAPTSGMVWYEGWLFANMLSPIFEAIKKYPRARWTRTFPAGGSDIAIGGCCDQFLLQHQRYVATFDERGEVIFTPAGTA